MKRKYNISPERLAGKNRKISDALRGKKLGENNSRWNGGTSEYKNHCLLKINRLMVLRSANYVCEKCGGIAIFTHHRDGFKNNHNADNLMPVCRSCHCKIHSGRKNKKADSR